MVSTSAQIYDIKVGDIDLYGHVNHVAYFYYLEEATVKFLKAHDISIIPGNITPVVANASCKYIHSIEYPATILIDSVASKINPRKLLITHTIKSEDESIVYAIAEKTMIWVDFKLKDAVDLPIFVINNLQLDILNRV